MALEIKVSDDEFLSEAGRAMMEADNAEEVLAQLVALMDSINEEAIKEGNVAKNFKQFTEKVKNMQKQLQQLVSEEVTLVQNFIADIDEADQMLYN